MPYPPPQPNQFFTGFEWIQKLFLKRSPGSGPFRPPTWQCHWLPPFFFIFPFLFHPVHYSHSCTLIYHDSCSLSVSLRPRLAPYYPIIRTDNRLLLLKRGNTVTNFEAADVVLIKGVVIPETHKWRLHFGDTFLGSSSSAFINCSLIPNGPLATDVKHVHYRATDTSCYLEQWFPTWGPETILVVRRN